MQTWKMPSNTYDMVHHGRGEVELEVSPSLSFYGSGVLLRWNLSSVSLLRWNLSCASDLASHALPFSIHWRNYHVINIPEIRKIIFWSNLTGR